ncbi:MAG: ribosome silencing factor [Thiotrichaceae bacterium]|nr:ribosome silencing factor [Thiotrichaceae bacterium]
MNTKQLTQFALDKLDDMKAQDIRVLDVSEKSSVTEVMIIATGISTVHVKAIAGRVSLEAKKQNHQPLGVEGEQNGEWVLVDLDDVVVHVMLQQTRDFYNLEKLWAVEVEIETE